MTNKSVQIFSYYFKFFISTTASLSKNKSAFLTFGGLAIDYFKLFPSTPYHCFILFAVSWIAVIFLRV